MLVVLVACTQASSLQDKAGDAERLALEVRGLHSDLKTAFIKMKELTVANTGGQSAPAWLVRKAAAACKHKLSEAFQHATGECKQGDLQHHFSGKESGCKEVIKNMQ